MLTGQSRGTIVGLIREPRGRVAEVDAGRSGRRRRPSAARRGAVSEPVRLLLVADRPAPLAALEAQLGGSEAELVRAASPEEAARLAGTVGFAGVVLDLAGPAARGLAAAGLIRGVARARSTPIVVLVAADAADA